MYGNIYCVRVYFDMFGIAYIICAPVYNSTCKIMHVGCINVHLVTYVIACDGGIHASPCLVKTSLRLFAGIVHNIFFHMTGSNVLSFSSYQFRWD